MHHKQGDKLFKIERKILTCLGHAIKLEKRRVQRIGYFLRLKLDYPFENDFK